MLRVLLGQFCLPDEEANEEADEANAGKDNVHFLNGIPVGGAGNLALVGRQGLDDVDVGSGVASAKLGSNVGAEFVDEIVVLPLHHVSKDDTTDGDRRRGTKLADKLQTGGGGTDVARLDVGLEADERRLEICAHTETSDHLEQDDSGPVRTVSQVGEETETDRHQEHAANDGDLVVASFLDKDANKAGNQRQSQDKR